MYIDRRLIHLGKQSRLPILFSVTFGSAGGIFTIIQAYLISHVITLVFIEHRTIDDIWRQLTILMLVSLSRALFQYLSQVEGIRGSNKIKSMLRDALFNHLVRLGPQYATTQQGGELTNTLMTGIESLDAYFSQYLPQLLLSAIIPIFIFATVLPIDILSGFVLLFTAPIIPVFMMLIGHLAQAISRKQWESLSRLSSYYLDLLQGLTTLKLFGRSQRESNRIAQIGEEFRKTTMNVLKIAFLSALVLEMAATISAAVIAVEVGLRLLYGRLEFEPALFILIITPEFYQPLRALGARFHAGMEGLNASRRIYEILDTPFCVNSPSLSQISISSPVSVRFRDVSYRYPGQSADAISGVTFHLHPGQKTALVGASGSGKSTLIKLLLEFIAPIQGRILVNGTDLLNLEQSDWLRQVSWMPQRPYLFHGTVIENICLARPSADTREIDEVIRKAHLHEVLERLPKGINSMIGEQGSRLSAGEAQRVALARVFLKQARLLVLDEPTSNLDVQTEEIITAAIDELKTGRCVLISAHRLRTIQNADQILLMHEGKIQGTGSHTMLLQSNPRYAAMFSPDRMR